MKLMSKKTTLVGVIVVIVAIVFAFSASRQKAANNEFFTARADKGPIRNVYILLLPLPGDVARLVSISP